MGHVQIKGDYWWVSCLPGREWQVEADKLAEYVKPKPGDRRGIVYLSCKYQKTEDGVGLVEYLELFFYAKHDRWLGIERITVYPHPSVWREIDKEQWQFLLTRLVVWEMVAVNGDNRQKAQEVGLRAALSNEPMITTVAWMGGD